MLEKLRAPRAMGREPEVDMRLGAVREKLEKLGYHPVSALGGAPGLCCQTEHPVALQCGLDSHVFSNPLVMLVLWPIDDDELAKRVSPVLGRYKLTSGPCRHSIDGARRYPLRADGGMRSFHELNTRVVLYPGEPQTVLLPLDAEWSRSMLHTPYDSLPEVSNSLAEEIFEALKAMRIQLAEERRPPEPPKRRAFLGW